MKFTKKLALSVTLFVAMFASLCMGAVIYFTAADAVGMTFKPGAEIRLVQDSYGIRFGLDVDADTYAAVAENDNAELGVVIAPDFAIAAAKEQSGDLIEKILELYPQQNGKDSITVKIDPAKMTDNGDGTYSAKCALVNLKDTNLKYSYRCVAYYTVDGVTYVYGGESDARSVSDVASAYISDPQADADYKLIAAEMVAKTVAVKLTGSAQCVTVGDGKVTVDLEFNKNLGDSVDLSVITNADTSLAFENPAVVVEENIVTLNGTRAINESAAVTAHGGLIEYNVTVTAAADAETDVKDGVDFANLIPEDEEIAQVTLAGEPVALTEGSKAQFEKTDAGENIKVYTVTTVSGKDYTVNLKLWSLIIDDESELTAMNQYTYSDTVHYGAQRTYGWFKLNADIPMTNAWSADYMVGNGDYTAGTHGFVGVFDGCNHSITGFVIPNVVNKVAMFYAAGQNTVIRNLKITAENKSTGGFNSAVLALSADGGTFENIELTVALQDVYIDNNYGETLGGGGMFEYIHELDAYDGVKLTLNNVKIIAKDTATGERATAPLGIIKKEKDVSGRTELNGVTIAGFKNVMYSATTPVTDLEGLQEKANCTDVEIFRTLSEYNESLYIKLDAVETDVKDGLNLAALIDGEIVSVTENGEPVALESGKITYTAEDASPVARNYLITDAEGKIYSLSATVYSALISDEEELRGAHEYQTVVTDQYGSKIGGYFKFDENVTMTQGAWKKEDMFGFGPSSWYSGIYGFVGTIDGNGKTITGLEIDGVQNLTSGNGFIYTLAEGGVIKDLTFEGAKMNISGGCNGGFIAAHVQGGTIENVKITVTYPEGYAEGDPVNYARAGGVLLGEMGRNKENTTVTVKNVTVIAGDEATGSRQYSSPIGCKKDEAGSVSKDKIKFEDVTFVGFETLMVWVGGVRVTTAEGLEEYITCTNVVSMTAEEYQASLA